MREGCPLIAQSCSFVARTLSVISMAKDGESSTTGAERHFPPGLKLVSDKSRARRAVAVGKDLTGENTMDTLIVFITASFIATYAILVYRALPQE
jgi:hypothetical protein